MKIVIAKTAGFCMGVHRAVEMALDAPGKYEKPICTYGPLIHNPQVLSLLKEKGVSVINSIPEKGSGTVLIRAHGVPPQTKQSLKNAGFTVIDATCPKVIKVQTIIAKHAKEGYACIIIGDRDHPEVIGLLGYGGEKGYVAAGIDEIDAFPAFDNAIIVAQTTQNTLLFDGVKQWAARKFPHYKIFDTICDSTERRQEEAKALSESVDAVVIVGGKNSGNTQRLAQIAMQAGKIAYHIESEEELDLKRLCSARAIGLTAGASTPNWVIKRIYRKLESLSFKDESGWRKWLFSLQSMLLLTNIYLASGAGCLCYACAKLCGIWRYSPYIVIAMLYVQSMHILNNLIGMKADRYNDPDRAAFYNDYKVFMAALALLSGGLGLSIAAKRGILPFLLLLMMSILGLSYNIKILPDSFKYQRIRDIPGSKTILIAAAWGVVTALFAPLSLTGSLDLGSILAFMWAASLVFVRTAFFDLSDMQGDRIVGKETLPLLLGEKRTLKLLKSMLIAMLLILPLSGAAGLTSGLGLPLSICPLLIFAIIMAHERGYILPGIKLEFLIESQFIFAGLITLIWSLLSSLGQP
ncbi:MAG: 4-hydroxy-3-methylbut-2-enyl diphosphate reductase [Desulfobacteraceae bacterium IS3]|nr:MAG: 4-hydroxy-3-methylbut-2-enyl diphosphate reductase [Desulfobacteraceae bacterium IS3]